MFGTIDVKIRPLRLAFLVDPSTPHSIREAIQLNSTLWGGAFNPLIPIYKKAPRAWRDQFSRGPTAEAVITGYIDAFDPDILVECGVQSPSCVANRGLKIVRSVEIWANYRADRSNTTPKYGIGVFELLNCIFKEHFRYKEKFPVRVVFPRISKRNALFWAAFVGKYPADILATAMERFHGALDIETVDAVPSTIKTLIRGRVLFPRRITEFDLSVRGRTGFRKDDFLFYMDASEAGDVIDYWNLRALGKQVLPVPKQFAGDPEFRDLAVDFVNRAHWSYKHNPKIWNCATFLRSRHVTMGELQAYAKGLNIKKASDSNQPALSLQHWYPRIWDEWARGKDGAEPADVIEEVKSVDVPKTEGQVQFRTYFPTVALKSSGWGEPRCANEIGFRFYGTSDFMAQVFPKTNGQNVKRAISPLASMPGDCRVGRNGLVRLVKHDGWTQHWEIHRSQEVFFAWLRDLGWQPELSPPGLIAKELFSQVEGFPRVFANEDLLKLLEHMNGGPLNERELSVGEVKNRLAKISVRTNLHDYLVQKKAFRLGAKVQCPSCRRHSWFSVDDVKEELVCPRCLKRYPAIGNVDQATWCYRTAGPFSVPGYADGAYCVLLSLETLGQHWSSISLTPALCFTAKGGGQSQLEADFGALWQESVFEEVIEGAIFGECKTFDKFEKKDVQRIAKIAKKFPGAVLAFCTLRKSLQKDEIREITKLARTGRKYWKSNRPINPVLVLTGNEILSLFGPPSCWEDMGLPERFHRVYSFLDVCDATQQIYLRLPPWEEVWHNQWERKRTRIAQRMRQFAARPPGAPRSPQVRPNLQVEI